MMKNKGRVVGLDVHPDSFAGAVVEGHDPASAVVLSTSTRVELERLEEWARRHTSTEDTLVLEASGNAFAVGARLRAIDREVEILDSHRAGKVGKVYCANDRVDAVKIARIYFERALTHRVATRSKDSGAARDLQCVSGSGKGIDPGQATTALDVERTLCASGEGPPLMPPPCNHAPACLAGVDAGPSDVAPTIARQPFGGARTSHSVAPAHGARDRGRGSAAAIDPTLWHQSCDSLRSGGGGGRRASLQAQQKVGRIPWTQPERLTERQLSRQRSTQAAWKRSASRLTHPIRQEAPGSK